MAIDAASGRCTLHDMRFPVTSGDPLATGAVLGSPVFRAAKTGLRPQIERLILVPSGRTTTGLVGPLLETNRDLSQTHADRLLLIQSGASL